MARGYLYGVFALSGGWTIETDLRRARKILHHVGGGEVRRLERSGWPRYGWDAPTFRVSSDHLEYVTGNAVPILKGE